MAEHRTRRVPYKEGAGRAPVEAQGTTMTEIKRVLKRAAWRLFVIDVMRTAAVTGSAAIFAIIIARVTDFYWPWVAAVAGGWLGFIGGAAGAAVVVTLLWSALRRARALEVAREVDQRANLRESISTALCVAGSDDPWAKAVVETARDRARSVNVRRSIPYVSPRLAPMPMAFLLVLTVVWFSLGEHYVWPERAAREQAQAEIRQVAAELDAGQKKIEELIKRAELDLDADGDNDLDLEGEHPEATTPEQLQRNALRKLTTMAERIKKQLDSGEKNQKLEAMKKMMRQLRQPGPGPLNDLAQAMQRGDFAGAKEELDKLAQQLGNNELNDQQRAQLAKQLENLAKQLEELSNLQKQLEEQLKQAGLSEEQAKKLAQNPEALAEALQQMQGLTEQQKQQLQQAAESMQAACSSCAGMGAALSQMAGGMSAGGMTQEGMDGMANMGEQLSAGEMLEAQMQNLRLALGECRGMMAGLSQWRPGESNRFGKGSGGPGKGTGLSPEAQEAAFNKKREKDSPKRHLGPIIGETLVFGNTIRGESREAFTEAVQTAARPVDEEIAHSEILPEFEDAVKQYLGRL
ncbi:MAG: hypothetical protein IIB55_03045, partial [Planctomycetes bacterium]|nr:hypothetical protein [Planctomycetota bacterium]